MRRLPAASGRHSCHDRMLGLLAKTREARSLCARRGPTACRIDPWLHSCGGLHIAHVPETHGFLRELRAVLDGEYPDRILLAEANGIPSQVAQYFGDGT